jgi:adiponectin receptor
MQDNPYLRSGYRPELLTFHRCFHSLFYLHNETGNIYTHMIGALFFVCLAVYTDFAHLADLGASWGQRLAFYLFFVGALCCLGLSTLFHTCFAHSPSMNYLFSKLDYTGITALITGSVMPVIYFCFYCHEWLMTFYLIMTGILAALCAWASFTESYREPEYKWVRLLLFICLAATALIPVCHFMSMYGVDHVLRIVDVAWVLGISCPLYLTGASVYLTKFPERFAPGRFDIWCHSHQLWHCFVIAAAIAHFVGMRNMLAARMEHQCEVEALYLS